MVRALPACACAIAIIRWSANASSDKLRASARGGAINQRSANYLDGYMSPADVVIQRYLQEGANIARDLTARYTTY
jgi:hypothetical protein